MGRPQDKFCWDNAEKLPDGRWKCKHCGEEFSGAASRIRNHLSGQGNDIRTCAAVPCHIQEEALNRTPMKSLFLFPYLTSGFKRPFLPGNLGGESECGNMMKPPLVVSSAVCNALLNPPQMCHDPFPQGSLVVEETHVNKTNAYLTLPSTDLERAKKAKCVTAVESKKVTEGDTVRGCDEDNITNSINWQHILNQTPTAVSPSLEMGDFSGLLPFLDEPDWLPYSAASTFESFPGLPQLRTSSLPPITQEMRNQHLIDDGFVDMSVEANTQSGMYFDWPTIAQDAASQYPSLVGKFGSSQDLQSDSLADSQAFSIQDFPGGTLQNSSWQLVNPWPTITKVQKTGSVGRSIDVTSYRNYEELLSAIECMFGLDGLLSDPRGSGWKLVYVDYENDILLFGDDPWEEFVCCVRFIKILSPAEVKQIALEVGTEFPDPCGEISVAGTGMGAT